MAQQIVTLASEETSQDILARVKNTETNVSNIENSSAIWGGVSSVYDYVTSTGNTARCHYIKVNGRGRFFFNKNFGSGYLEVEVDGINLADPVETIKGTPFTLTNTFIDFRNSIRILDKRSAPNGSAMFATYFFIQWQTVGTVEKSVLNSKATTTTLSDLD